MLKGFGDFVEVTVDEDGLGLKHSSMLEYSQNGVEAGAWLSDYLVAGARVTCSVSGIYWYCMAVLEDAGLPAARSVRYTCASGIRMYDFKTGEVTVFRC